VSATTIPSTSDYSTSRVTANFLLKRLPKPLHGISASIPTTDRRTLPGKDRVIASRQPKR